MNIVYPASLLNPKIIDEMFQDEANFLKQQHIVFHYTTNRLDLSGNLIYRGWMLDHCFYLALEMFAERKNLNLITSYQDYFNAHYIQNWYHIVSDITPKTFLFNDIEDVKENLSKTNLSSFFIKDSVKSLTTSRGSIANNEIELFEVINTISELKGIEGIIALREVHNFIPDTEIRYFSYYGKLFSPNEVVYDLAQEVAQRFKHLPFISIDIIKDDKNNEWLVEIGDGQVSDLKMWNPNKFSDMLFNFD